MFPQEDEQIGSEHRSYSRSTVAARVSHQANAPKISLIGSIRPPSRTQTKLATQACKQHTVFRVLRAQPRLRRAPPPPPPNHRLRTQGACLGPLRPIRLGTARWAALPLEPRLWAGRPLYDRSIRIGCGFCTAPRYQGGVTQIGRRATADPGCSSQRRVDRHRPGCSGPPGGQRNPWQATRPPNSTPSPRLSALLLGREAAPPLRGSGLRWRPGRPGRR